MAIDGSAVIPRPRARADKPRVPKSLPSGSVESRLFATGARRVGGVDEVGRGAWAGPLTVGVAVVTKRSLYELPEGVNDSKMLTPEERSALFDPLRTSLVDHAIGHASALECDELGMTAAQRLACRRALESLHRPVDALILDGNFNFSDHPGASTLIGADRLSLVVAAASVLAKVTRDTLMIECAPEHPPYRFERNKGYPSPEHKDALASFGMSAIHRQSWAFAANLLD